MTVVCGIDLSESAALAARAAAAVASRLCVPLQLVHVLDELGVELALASGEGAAYEPSVQRVRAAAGELSAAFRVEVQPIVVPGRVVEGLVDQARAVGAGLLVVGASGASSRPRWLVGGVAERLARVSPVPTLVVRESESVEAWARGEAPLRVLVGAEPNPASKAALRFAAELRSLGSTELRVTRVVWPFAEQVRLGVPSTVRPDRLRLELGEPLLRDLRAWTREVTGDEDATFELIPAESGADIHLAREAATSDAHLLVVGAHQRAGITRLWQGSVSRGVLHHAPCNVAVVPRATAAPEPDRTLPRIRSVLVPTDFSPLANRAVPVAYGLVGPGGVVHLLHVVTPGHELAGPAPRSRLRALIPDGAMVMGISTEIDVVTAEDAGSAIGQAAARLGVDAVCMATHGRTGLSRLAAGSQAEEVMRRVRQPVILVPPERDA